MAVLTQQERAKVSVAMLCLCRNSWVTRNQVVLKMQIKRAKVISLYIIKDFAEQKFVVQEEVCPAHVVPAGVFKWMWHYPKDGTLYIHTHKTLPQT